MSITKDIIWSKLLAMKDEDIKVVKDIPTARLIIDITHTREPYDNGFIITFDMESMQVHKSYFVMPPGCQYCANSIWSDYFLHLPNQILK